MRLSADIVPSPVVLSPKASSGAKIAVKPSNSLEKMKKLQPDPCSSLACKASGEVENAVEKKAVKLACFPYWFAK